MIERSAISLHQVGDRVGLVAVDSAAHGCEEEAEREDAGHLGEDAWFCRRRNVLFVSAIEFSDRTCKAQVLPNGNWLIAEATGGRVVEVNADGEELGEYCHEIQTESNLVCEVLGGQRVPFDAATVRRWYE